MGSPPLIPPHRVPGVPARADEERLGEFCEAALALLPEGGGADSVLGEMLPSFFEILCSRVDDVVPLRTELDAWNARSDQLTRLAALHSGDEAASLRASLERARSQSASAIEALERLHASRPGAVESGPLGSDSEPRPTSDPPRVGQGLPSVEMALRQVCEAVLDLLRSGTGNRSILTQTIPSLIRTFQRFDADSLARLRGELLASEAAADQLMELAAAHCDAAAKELQNKVERAHAQGVRVLSTLEKLRAAADGPIEPSTPPDVARLPERAGDASPLSDDRRRAIEFYEMGARSHQQQDLAAAEKLYGEALRLDGDLRLAWFDRGRILLLRGKAQSAIADFTQALRLHSQDAAAYRYRGDALTLTGRFERAVADYDRALELAPDSTVARYNRAVALRQAGRLDPAWEEFGQLLHVEAHRGPAHSNRGLISLARGDREQAIREFRAALAHQPNSREALERLRELGASAEEDPDITIVEPGEDEFFAETKETPKLAAAPTRREPPQTPQSETRVPVERRRTKSKDPAAAPSAAPAVPAATRVDHELAIDLLTTIESAPSDTKADSPRPALEELPGIPGGPTNAPTSPARTPAGPPPKERTSLERASRSATEMATVPGISPQPAPTSICNIDIRCPACKMPSTMRWDRLQAGTIFVCRACRANFTAGARGELIVVEKQRGGTWRVPAVRDGFLSDRRVVAGLAAAAVALLIFVIPSFRGPPPIDAGLPRELEPRAKAFAVAWLKEDFPTMLRLTDPSRSSDLPLWCMQNPSPSVRAPSALENGDVKFKVDVVTNGPPVAEVQVRFDSLQAAQPSAWGELPTLAWKQGGDTWSFQPRFRAPM